MNVVPCTGEHIKDFLSRPVRPEDYHEWLVACGQPPHAVLPHSLAAEGSTVRCLVTSKGHCLAVWGVHVEGEKGTVWLIAAQAAKAHGWSINRRWAAAEFARMKQMAPTLQAFPWVEQSLHHRWLEWMGFKPIGTVQQGAGLFRHYEWRANVH